MSRKRVGHMRRARARATVVPTPDDLEVAVRARLAMVSKELGQATVYVADPTLPGVHTVIDVKLADVADWIEPRIST